MSPSPVFLMQLNMGNLKSQEEFPLENNIWYVGDIVVIADNEMDLQHLVGTVIARHVLVKLAGN